MIAVLPAWKIKQLKKFHKTLNQKHKAYRVNAVILLGTGYTPQQVSEILLISEGSVRNYWNDFKQFGKDELIKRALLIDMALAGNPFSPKNKNKNCLNTSTKISINVHKIFNVILKRNTKS